MRIKLFIMWLIGASLIFVSCSTPKNVSLFQDVNTGSIITSALQNEIRIKKGDKLLIKVTSQDPELSKLFNLVTAQTLSSQTTSSTSSVGIISDGQMSYYTVDTEGDINFPVLGKLHIAGMSKNELIEFIEKQIQDKNYIKDPIVVADFANVGVSILGEVKNPGRYDFNKEKMTIIDAIVMAGDLTSDGERENILVLRKEADGKQIGYRLDFTDLNNLANSPVFYLQQDDIIYVQPNDKKKRESTSAGNTPFTPSFWVSIGSFAVTITTFIIMLTKL